MKINTTELFLRSTSIREIKIDDFSSLGHLEKLTIEQNQLLNNIQAFSFQNMLNLTTLTINSNPLLESFNPETLQGLVNLRELNVVNSGFTKLTDLTRAIQMKYLPNLRKLNISGNHFLDISAHDFDHIGGGELEELDLTSCNIQRMDRDALKPLKKLSKLYLGNNSLEIHSLVDILENTISSGIDLKSIDLNSLGMQSTIPESLSKMIAASNIDSLTLSNNTFSMLDEKTIPTVLPNLKTLEIVNGESTFVEDSFFNRIPNVETLILRKHNLSYFTIPKSLPNLKYLDLSEFTKKEPHEFFHLETEVDESAVEYLDLHETRLAFLLKNSFQFMPALKELSLKKSLVVKFSTGAFNNLKSLKYLNLEDNKFFIMYIKYPSEPFLGLDNLETLLLAGNAISYISSGERNLLKHLTNLKCLGLQRNSLEVITAEDFAPLKKLEILDISSNPLYAWDDRVFFKSRLEKFFASSNHFNYLSQAMLDDFNNFNALDIDYSPFSCDCRMMRRMFPDKFLMMRMKASEKYRNLLCAGSHELTVMDYLETMDYSDCEPKKSMMMYFLGSFFAITFLAAILILVYIVRDQIPYASAFFRSSHGRQSIL